MFRRIV